MDKDKTVAELLIEEHTSRISEIIRKGCEARETTQQIVSSVMKYAKNYDFHLADDGGAWLLSLVMNVRDAVAYHNYKRRK